MKISHEILHMPRDSVEDFLGRRRKHRLDHLSKEEKIERKKMKNRVAAQTSRDRKKMKVESMEMALRVLSEENEQLQERNSFLEERLRELETRLSGLETKSLATVSGNVLEKVMALNLLAISTILTVWYLCKRSLMESSWLMIKHQQPFKIASRKAKAPERFHMNSLPSSILHWKTLVAI